MKRAVGPDPPSLPPKRCSMSMAALSLLTTALIVAGYQLALCLIDSRIPGRLSALVGVLRLSVPIIVRLAIGSQRRRPEATLRVTL